MKKNKIDIFRKKFKNKNTVGGWLQLGDPNSAKIISNSKNLDWICLDMEHGLINLSSIKITHNLVTYSILNFF